MILRNLKIAPRSMLLFGIMFSLIFILSVISIVQMEKIHASGKEIEKKWMSSLELVGRLDAGALRLRLETLRVSATNDEKSRSDTINSFPSHSKEFFNNIDLYSSNIFSYEESQVYDELRKEAAIYKKMLLDLENFWNSKSYNSALKIIDESIRPLTNSMQVKINSLRVINNEGALAAGVEAESAFSNAIITICLLSIMALIVSIVLSLLLVRSITRPIADALVIAEKIAGKDLSSSVYFSGNDEMAAMLYAISRMQSNLRKTIGCMADSSNQLASASEEMSCINNEASKLLTKQNDEVTQAAAAVTQLSAAVDNVARSAAYASDCTHRTQLLTTSGLETVESGLRDIRHLSDNVTNATERVRHLSARVVNISKVVDVIRSIADQTNLLALNAAIEAARAGEMGRGFAVVADEVRALAHRTKLSTREIESMISGIQIQSLDVLQVMESSQKIATDSTLHADHAKKSFSKITDAMTALIKQNIIIAGATEEQAKVAKEIDSNLSIIKELSEQSSTGSSQTAVASIEVSRLAIALSEVSTDFKF